jgi:hypothetical protein
MHALPLTTAQVKSPQDWRRPVTVLQMMPHDVDHRRNKAWRVVDRSPQGLRLLESGWSTKCQTDSVLGPSAGRWVQGSLPAGRVLSGQSGYVMGHPHITVVTSYGPTQVSVTDQYPPPLPDTP